MKPERAVVNAGTAAKDGAEATVFAEPFVYLSEGMTPLKPRQIGLVPGALAPLLPVDLPAGLRGYVREQVAGRQLCGSLGAGPEMLEIRPYYSPEQAQRWTRALVAGRDQVAQWRRQAGQGGRAVLPDYLALPVSGEIWTLATGPGGSVIARLGPDDGFSAAPNLAHKQLAMALDHADPLPRAVFCPGAFPAETETLFSARDIPLVTSEEALRKIGLSPPRALEHGELNFDLRRDPQAARARLARRVLPWRWPLLTALLAGGLWAGAQMLAISELHDQTTMQRAATLDLVRADFVPDGPVLDIRTQVNRVLAQARVAASGSGASVAPLDLIGLAADVFAARKANPKSLYYTAEDGLSALIQVENFTHAEELANALRGAGLTVRVVESRAGEGDEGVQTELRINAEAGE